MALLTDHESKLYVPVATSGIETQESSVPLLPVAVICCPSSGDLLNSAVQEEWKVDTIASLYCCECNFAKYCMFLNISPFQISATCYWSAGRRNMWFDRYASLTKKVKLFRE